MKYQGRTGAEWGFKNPIEGWFDVVITDDIDIITNQASGKQSLRVPTKVTDGEMAGGNINVFCAMDTEFGEQKFADIIANVGLQAQVDKAFPGDVSPLDPGVIRKMQTALPGKGLRLKLEPFTREGKTYGNIVKIDKIGGAQPATKAPAKAAPVVEADVEEAGW
jgi:hypothetical protein